MRSVITMGIVGAAMLASAPAMAVQKVGARTQTPAQLLAQMGEGSSDAEIERAAAAAAAFPLGSLQNPVRVGGPEGRRLYVARLRCPNGKPPVVGNVSSGGVGGYGSVVDTVPLDCGGVKSQLAVGLYHEGHVETRAPVGFSVAR